MRDKLIELIRIASHELTSRCVGDCGDCADKIADHILADGWIRPPCKVGDTVYADTLGEIEGFVVVSIELAYTANGFEGEFVVTSGKYPLLFKFDNIGKTVFLAKEEAEKALKGVEQK